MDIPGLVRQMRSRLKQSQAEFARLLGCSQNSVSRYESGSHPTLGILLRLYDVGLPAEREILETHIKRGLSARGKFFSKGASVDVLRGLIEDSAIEEQFLQNVSPALRTQWEPLVEIIAALILTDRVVDESIVEVLQLWRWRGPSEPRMAALLRDVVGYLRLQLANPS
jgi:transcriptional regulator with XRE-family HTH domain